MSAYKICKGIPIPRHGLSGASAKAAKSKYANVRPMVHAAYEAWQRGEESSRYTEEADFIKDNLRIFSKTINDKKIIKRWITEWKKSAHN